MIVKLYANIGSDAVPNWHDILDTERIHFTGAGSTASLAQPIVRPSAGYVYPEECWIGPEVMLGGVKVNNWVKPSAVSQKGKVFKATFSEGLIAAPIITAYDEDNYATWAKQILAGTEQTNWTSLLKCACTNKESVNTPPATGWATQETGRA